FVIPVQAPFLFQRVFGVGNSTIGFLAAAMALVQTFVSLAYGRIRSRLGFGAIFALAFVMMGLGNLLLGLADRAWIAALVLVCLGVGHGLLMPNLSYWALSLAPEPARGRVMGGLATFFALGQFVSPLVFHPLIALASLQGAFVICGAALFGLSAAVGTAAWRRRSRTGRPLESEA
ncbi:MAG: MFS transporter, partial [Proteobacteria bacterium]|nr:MFS transporter [Pseudomonadota bacterium]